MRQQLLAALDFPRNVILTLIEEHECPCRGRFDAGNECCGDCDLNRQCHWVTFLAEYSDFADKPTYTVNASLRYGVQLVEELSRDWSHEKESCTCEACSWLRDAGQLIAEFEETLPANPFRPTRVTGT